MKGASDPLFLAPRWWGGWLALCLLRLAVMLPFRWQYRLAHLIAKPLRKVCQQRDRIVQTNVDACLPELSEPERRRIVSDNWTNMTFMLFEAGMAWWQGSSTRLQKRVRIIGLEHILNANRQGQGVVILAGHFLVMEIVGAITTFHVPLGINYRVMDNPMTEMIVKRHRQRYYQQVEPIQQSLSTIHYLRSGGNLWHAPDQHHSGKRSVEVRFFNHPVCAFSSASALARLGNAAVVPTLYQREGERYTVRFLPPLEGFPSGDDAADTQRYFTILEGQIRRFPGQYLWAHRRFKNVIDY